MFNVRREAISCHHYCPLLVNKSPGGSCHSSLCSRVYLHSLLIHVNACGLPVIGIRADVGATELVFCMGINI